MCAQQCIWSKVWLKGYQTVTFLDLHTCGLGQDRPVVMTMGVSLPIGVPWNRRSSGPGLWAVKLYHTAEALPSLNVSKHPSQWPQSWGQVFLCLQSRRGSFLWPATSQRCRWSSCRAPPSCRGSLPFRLLRVTRLWWQSGWGTNTK